jgi:hypothetical protein
MTFYQHDNSVYVEHKRDHNIFYMFSDLHIIVSQLLHVDESIRNASIFSMPSNVAVEWQSWFSFPALPEDCPSDRNYSDFL